jgi:hypothetical protein
MAGFIRRFRGRDAPRAARTAIEVAACQQRNDLVRDQIVFDLRIPVVARCSPTPPARRSTTTAMTGILVKVGADQLPESITAEI